MALIRVPAENRLTPQPPRVESIGPGESGNLLEVIWLEFPDRAPIVIHAMPLRRTFCDLLHEGRRLMARPKTCTTATGRVLTGDDVDAIAEAVEHAGYDVEELKTRRRGRPLLGSAPVEVVPVRLDPELKSAGPSATWHGAGSVFGDGTRSLVGVRDGDPKGLRLRPGSSRS